MLKEKLFGILVKYRGRGGMADAADSKSVYGDIVRVQVPSPARKPEVFITSGFFYRIKKQVRCN